MSHASTVPVFFDAFAAGLQAHLAALPGFNGTAPGTLEVHVFAEPLVADVGEWVALNDADTSERPAGFGQGAANIPTEERYTANGRISVFRSGALASSASDARDRVGAIFAELKEYVRNNRSIGGTVRSALVVSARWNQEPQETGWQCFIDFGIDVRADLRT